MTCSSRRGHHGNSLSEPGKLYWLLISYHLLWSCVLRVYIYFVYPWTASCMVEKQIRINFWVAFLTLTSLLLLSSSTPRIKLVSPTLFVCLFCLFFYFIHQVQVFLILSWFSHLSVRFLCFEVFSSYSLTMQTLFWYRCPLFIFTLVHIYFPQSDSPTSFLIPISSPSHCWCWVYSISSHLLSPLLLFHFYSIFIFLSFPFPLISLSLLSLFNFRFKTYL